MKTIVLKIDDDAVGMISGCLKVMGMTQKACGIINQFVLKIVKALDEGKEELHIQLKTDQECQANQSTTEQTTK